MITLEKARETLPEGYAVSDTELKQVLAYFYFLGEQAYEHVREGIDD